VVRVGVGVGQRDPPGGDREEEGRVTGASSFLKEEYVGLGEERFEVHDGSAMTMTSQTVDIV
jgi:hypothetical protein